MDKTLPPDPKRPSRAQANVRVRRAHQSEPRLPHERDESADSANPAPPEHRHVGRQAAADVRDGKVDTDIGPVLEQTAADHLPPAPPTRAAPSARRR